MIICVCNNVSDREIQTLVAEGKSLREIIRCSQASQSCGACSDDLRRCAEKGSSHNCSTPLTTLANAGFSPCQKSG